MTAFSHYGASDDISGVTSWLAGMLRGLRALDESVCLRLHHFGATPEEGTLYHQAQGVGVQVSGTALPSTTRRAVIDILEFLNREKPQVFLPQTLPAPHFAAKLAAEAGLPWIFTLHSDDPEYWALAELAAPDRWHGVWVAVSLELAREARDRFPDADVRVIPCGVEIPLEKAVWHRKRFRIVYSGRMVEEQKRISMVLDVFIAACRQHPHIEAVFLGDGSGRAAAEQRVIFEGQADRIRFAGRLDPGEVLRELLEAQAFVLMSDYEGLPVSLLEAMACGVVPVVRNIRSGIPEVVHHGETGLLVNEDPVAAAREIVKLATDDAGWMSMSEAGRALVIEKYSHESCMQKWHTLINEMRQRSAVRYPIRVPLFPQLPPYDKRLWKFDRRSPLWLRKVRKRLRRMLSV